jgi:hypothetical protein
MLSDSPISVFPLVSSADADDLGCTQSLAFAELHAASLQSFNPCGSAEGHDSNTSPSLRSLSLSVTAYERAIKENEQWLEDLVVPLRYRNYAMHEYIKDIEFLEAGLARVLEQLSERGLHCVPHGAEIYVTQPRLPEKGATDGAMADAHVAQPYSAASFVSSGIQERVVGSKRSSYSDAGDLVDETSALRA